MPDRLSPHATPPGLVIVNFGDPTFTLAEDLPSGLELAEEIFLRLVAYLAFAERVAIPARYVLTGDDMFTAVRWARPLLEAGILQLERREDAESFEVLARQQGLDDDGLRRARTIDTWAPPVRQVVWHDLAERWCELIADDLDENGAFRRLVEARLGQDENVDAAVASAHSTFRDHGQGLDDFFRVLGENLPEASEIGRRWAMARYYLTPTLFDSLNTREIPKSAGDLLIETGALDPPAPPEMPAPVATSQQQLRLDLALGGAVRGHTTEYCMAVLRVREELPRARALFREMWSEVELGAQASNVEQAMSAELIRQRVRRAAGHRDRAISLIATLAGFGGGLATQSMTPVESGVLGAAAGLAAQTGLGKLEQQRRIWAVTIDRLAAYSAPSG